MSAAAEDRTHTSAGRVVRIPSPGFGYVGGPVVDRGAPPTPDTVPDIVTSPLRADGLGPTTGIMLMVTRKGSGTGPSAVPVDAGWTLTVWIQDTVTRQWGAAAPIVVPENQWFRTFDFNGGPLWFQLDPASVGLTGFAPPDDKSVGLLDVHVVEL